MTALLVDAGNTRLKWGLLKADEIHDTGHVLQADIAAHGLLSLTTRLPRAVDRVFVSNVVGQRFATRLTGVLSAHYGCDVGFARTSHEAAGLVNGYGEVRQMGVDRWAAMVGAWREFERALVVVDAGTAVTIDAIDGSGQHLGGHILPGFGLMSRALGTETSGIPLFEREAWSAPRGLEIFGASTEAGVVQGAANAVVGAVDRAISVLRSNAYDPVTVLTGGDASAMLRALVDPPEHRPNLVLAGLAELMDRA
jgi:type III pantothenate kinase